MLPTRPSCWIRRWPWSKHDRYPGRRFLIDDNNPDGELLSCRRRPASRRIPWGPAPSMKDSRAAKESRWQLGGAHRVGAGQPSAPLVPLVFRNHPLGLLVPCCSRVMTCLSRRSSSLSDKRQRSWRLPSAMPAPIPAWTQMTSELRQRNEARPRSAIRCERSDQLAEQRNQLEEQRNQLAAQSIQLRIQRNQLREVNRLKSGFGQRLARAAHAAQRHHGLPELIHDQIYGPISATQDAIAGVLASSSNLLRLINQILDLSRIEAGRMEVYSRSSICTRWSPPSSARPRPWGAIDPTKFSCTARPTCVHTDAVKLQQILTNLIANAIKFTPQGTVIVDVRGEGADDSIHIAVKDTGIGIRSEHLELIFEERFRQVDGSSTRRYGGTGFGFWRLPAVWEMLGAMLTVESTCGIGSTFTIRLPRTPPTRSAARAQPRGRQQSGTQHVGSRDPPAHRRSFGRYPLADAAMRHQYAAATAQPAALWRNPGAQPTPPSLAAEPTPAADAARPARRGAASGSGPRPAQQ